VKITFEIPKHRWEDNIKMCLNDIDSEGIGLDTSASGQYPLAVLWLR